MIGPSRFTDEETYRATRLPVDLASTLTPAAYTSDEFFDLERERVFGRGWVGAACASEVAEAGDTVVAELAGRSAIVVRGQDGVLRAFENVCRHRGSRLLEPGRCRLAKHIKCPYHSWAYALDGRLLGTPLFTADSEVPVDQRGIFDMEDVRDFDKADYGLLPLPVEAGRSKCGSSNHALSASRRTTPRTLRKLNGGSNSFGSSSIPMRDFA